MPVAGSSTTWLTIDQVDAFINGLDQSSIANTLSTSGTLPPSTSGSGFRYNSQGKYIQSRTTGTAGVILKASLKNDTGNTMSVISIMYDFAIQTPAPIVSDLPGHVVYWSLTGAPGSWMRIPELSDGDESPGRRTAIIPIGSWPPDGSMYVIWVDDNADLITDPSYTIDNVSFGPIQYASISLVEPRNGQLFPEGLPITLRANVALPNPVTVVSFYNGPELLGSDTTAPFIFTWDNATVGAHALTCVATDTQGNTFSSSNTVTIVVVSNTSPAWVVNGLVAYYPFNGNANDLSPSALHGNIAAAMFVADRNGQSNAAIQFFTESSAVTVGDFPDLYQSFSISGWFFTTNAGFTGDGYRTLVSRGGYSAPETAWMVRLNSSFNYVIWLGSGDAFTEYTSSASYAFGTWQNFVVTYDGASSQVCIYINGNKDSCFSVAQKVSSHPGVPLLVGNQTSNRAMNGKMDDVRIYDRVLSETEVQRLHQHDLIPQPCFPHTARAVANLTNGAISSIDIIDPSCGFTNNPSVRIVGGGGTGATAVAVQSGGVLTRILLTASGAGYTNAPRVLIESPPYTPSLQISVHSVKVTQHVRVNHRYVLEGSSDLILWSSLSEPFIAEAEYISQEIPVNEVPRYYRVREIP